jgi:hypothetical protein
MLEQPGQVTQRYYWRVAFPLAVTALTGDPSPVAKFVVIPGEAPPGPVDDVAHRVTKARKAGVRGR